MTPQPMTANIYSDLPTTPLAKESFAPLLTHPGIRIERIVSTGQASPPDFWYDQEEAEWVILLAGEAQLRFADETEARQLRPGDWLEIAAHRRHRVESTSSTPPAVWLAIFYPATT